MNVNWMRWTMAMQVLFFVGWARAEEYGRVDAVEFLLETRPVDPRDFVESMTLPVREAAAAVRWLEGRVRNRPKASEITPEKAALTDGDCVSQEILLVALLARYPEVALNVEEDTPTAARFAKAVSSPEGPGEATRGSSFSSVLRDHQRKEPKKKCLTPNPNL